MAKKIKFPNGFEATYHDEIADIYLKRKGFKLVEDKARGPGRPPFVRADAEKKAIAAGIKPEEIAKLSDADLAALIKDKA